MRQVIMLLGVLALLPAAEAQIGPASPRAITRPMPSKAPSGVDTIRAEAKLTLTRKGRVYLVEILKGSGDESFDKQWRKTLDEWRFIPAVTPEGEPVESTVHVIYKSNGLTVQPYLPDGSSDESTPNVINEAERLERMTCKDFLWEYELLIDALPRRLALLDPLLKTPKVMLAADTPLTEEQQKTLHDRYDDLVNDAARKCRDDPTASFWAATFKPLLQTGIQ